MKRDWDFKAVWVVDFEFFTTPGNLPQPLCVVGKELYTRETVKTWLPDNPLEKPPYSLDENSLFVAYFASAEMGCHIVLNWPRPANLLDLFIEFRNLTNGSWQGSASLLSAAALFQLDGGDTAYKDSMRERILQGPPYSETEKQNIMDYCEKDVSLTGRLFLTMKPRIDLPRALLRGRYMWSVALMENYGIPIDTEALDQLKTHWEYLKTALIEKIDKNYGVYQGTVFKAEKFKKWLIQHGIEWELTPTGLPRLDDDFFRDQAKVHPELKPLQELRYSIGQLKLNDISVGIDGRNRDLLKPFRSKTGRNQPSSSKFIFGNAVWLRNLIRPKPGKALAYVDFEQEEFGIGAALSQDTFMLEAYRTGDPYLAFAKQAGRAPPEATKESHPNIRTAFKTCVIALNYGMTEETFAKRINTTVAHARALFRSHRQTYSAYWKWIQDLTDKSKLTGEIMTVYGWKLKTHKSTHRTIQNFPMQANGAEILRLACMFALENGIRVCGPVHDALLIESPENQIEADVQKTQFYMEEASARVLNGFKLRTEAKIIKYPDHYTDPRGEEMWQRVWEVIQERNHAIPTPPQHTPIPQDT